ncbi:(2Fe-2S)-binding protein [Alicyclobacillus macrosporangiidus]|uniref:Sarcosine oxidase subunit alpha n=1 Tax=Alicyclobacillus macrosporangiidus TaxID=392015 RepID=A0A1I7LCH7_9BACL|nr:(2Fe-2S)-binding protein [Alicyclobacillus macrosporangiidus]SFV07431.1 sarcosine oxidase subunit alpha [Alicyclobacillus macrosporangiidus]
MHIETHPILSDLHKTPVTFTYDGHAVTAYEGQTLAGALMAAGVWTLGTSRSKGEARGVFCAGGWCGNCLVTVNGWSRVKACAILVKQGMSVQAQLGDPSVPRASSDRPYGGEGV